MYIMNPIKGFMCINILNNINIEIILINISGELIDGHSNT